MSHQINQTGAIHLVESMRKKKSELEFKRGRLRPFNHADRDDYLIISGKVQMLDELIGEIEAANEILAALGETVNQN